MQLRRSELHHSTEMLIVLRREKLEDKATIDRLQTIIDKFCLREKQETPTPTEHDTASEAKEITEEISFDKGEEKDWGFFQNETYNISLSNLTKMSIMRYKFDR